ncbi:MAG: pyridoxal phosphate-dependent aminotransferase family protein, partial [Bacteroidia bacterium]|nr:pyridoxal phosphate-dependent aminotransferase family protein [Bacteroidia bacterium]
MGIIPSKILNALNNRKETHLFRNLSVYKAGVDFISNDYLGFSKLGLLHQQFSESFSDQNFLSGSSGSRLISGNSEFKEVTEKEIALFHHSEAALLFNSGYDANIGLLSSVPQKNDLVISDELIHASIYDGIRLSYAKHYKFAHNQVNDLEDLINRHKQSFENIYVVVESIYSMDGDAAPLKEI